MTNLISSTGPIIAASLALFCWNPATQAQYNQPYNWRPVGSVDNYRADAYRIQGSARRAPVQIASYPVRSYSADAANFRPSLLPERTVVPTSHVAPRPYVSGSGASIRPSIASGGCAFTPNAVGRYPGAYSTNAAYAAPGGYSTNATYAAPGGHATNRYPIATQPVIRGASPYPPGSYVSRNLYGKTTGYNSYQPVRNLFRFLVP